jgi:hypothetical protein
MSTDSTITVTTSRATVFDDGARAAIANGMDIEVEGAKQAYGPIVAVVVRLD